MPDMPIATRTDAANRAFWNELCGTSLARSLGITDDSASSLARFDAQYFAMYPYLDEYLDQAPLDGRDVLEIGLGYGTVSQRIAEAGARYVGVDIAEGPVEMVRHRLRLHALPGDVRVGSALALPFGDNKFDRVVAIGCLHHTGNLPLALSEVARVLRQDGLATIMVYSAFSYRRWMFFTQATWRHLRKGWTVGASERERAAFDTNHDGGAAPETVFVSVRELRRMAAPHFATVTIHRENAGDESILRHVSRNVLLRTLGPLVGLDLYAHLRK